MATPHKLNKMMNNPNRSPLQDITHSLTKKKKNGQSTNKQIKTEVV
jgi:hypothetical protein